MIDPETELTKRLQTRTYRDLADEWGVSHAYLFDVATGKRPIGPKILDGLGLEKIVTYRRKRK